jgi:hypothetical protein
VKDVARVIVEGQKLLIEKINDVNSIELIIFRIDSRNRIMDR